MKNALSGLDKSISETNREDINGFSEVASSNVGEVSPMFIKWSSRVRQENKSVNILFEVVHQKIWHCLEIEQISLIPLKSVSMVKIC